MLGSDAAFDNLGAFGCKKPALKAGEGLADDDSAACGDYTVPRDALTAWASGHGSARGTSAAGQAHGLRQLAVGRETPFRDALDEGVQSLPGSVHGGKDSGNGRELPRIKRGSSLTVVPGGVNWEPEVV